MSKRPTPPPKSLAEVLEDERPSVPLSEVARCIGVGYRVLYQRVEAGVIPGFRLDRKGNFHVLKETIKRIIAGEFNDATPFDQVGLLPPGADPELIAKVAHADA